MRLLVFLLVLGAGAHWAYGMLPAAADPDVGAAIAIRCGELAPPLQRECRTSLQAAFDAGTRSPAEIVRWHCTRIENPWDGAPPDAPALCEERFGGWVHVSMGADGARG